MSKCIKYKYSEIREWYTRHEHDRCECATGPPDVWAEYMAWLLAELEQSERLAGKRFKESDR